MHPPKALAPGGQALDLSLVTKSEPGQTKQEEWKPAHVKGFFTLGNPGCNVSSSTRANPAPHPCHCPRDGGRVTSASSGPARASSAPAEQGVHQLYSPGHCRVVPKTLRKLRYWERTQQQGKLGRSHSLLHSLRHRPGDGVKKSVTAELCSFLLGQSPEVLLSSWTVIKHLVAVPCLQPAARASLALLT